MFSLLLSLFTIPFYPSAVVAHYPERPPIVVNNPYITIDGQGSIVNEFTATVSAYSEIDSCHTGESCLMANGVKAHIGAVACPRDTPLGSKISIEGLGELVCSDRTALRYNDRYDVFMGYGEEAYERAVKFGVKKLKVKIIK